MATLLERFLMGSLVTLASMAPGLAHGQSTTIVLSALGSLHGCQLRAVPAPRETELAEAAFAEGDYDAAAQHFLNVADTTDDLWATQGLFNAGLIYEQNLRRYDLARQQFERLITEYPESDYVDSALVRVAVNAKSGFDFALAAETYLTLDARGFSDTDFAEYPILDAARLLEQTERYEEAAEAYLAFVEAHPNTNEAPAALFRAAELYGRLGGTRRMFRLYRDFREAYGSDHSSMIDIDAAVIRSLAVEAAYRRAHGETRAARRLEEQVVEAYERRQPRDLGSGRVMAELAFNEAMAEVERWDSIALGDTIASQQAAIAERREGLDDVSAAFATVVEYNAPEWSVCAGYEAGHVYIRMAEALRDAPMPDFDGDTYAEDDYALMIEDIATLYEDSAFYRWESFAYPIMQGTNVQNECTIATMIALNRRRGPEYPVFRAERRELTTMPFSPQVFSVPPM